MSAFTKGKTIFTPTKNNHKPLKVRSAGSRTKTANTCQTVGHFYRPWVSIAESESDREIRRTLEECNLFTKYEKNI